jgi:hypothetical protein
MEFHIDYGYLYYKMTFSYLLPLVVVCYYLCLNVGAQLIRITYCQICLGSRYIALCQSFVQYRCRLRRTIAQQ